MKYECEKCEKIVDSDRIISAAGWGFPSTKLCFECYATQKATHCGAFTSTIDKIKYNKIMKYLEGK